MKDFTVLVVDDEEPICDIITDVLRWAYELNVITAHTASEARSLLIQNEIHLILLTVMMPETDGLSLARWIRSEPDLSEIPIIIVSAEDSQKDQELAFASGANGFLAKPFRSVELQAAIHPYLSVRSMEVI
jgi:DNA-binding response OmpR family regulator